MQSVNYYTLHLELYTCLCSGDRITGVIRIGGFNYKSLEDETDQKEHIIIARLSYSTLPLYLEKKFPVPLDASIFYRDRFAGDNNLLKSQYIGFGLGVYF